MDEKPERLTDHKAPVLAYISPAQRNLLLFFREDMPFGKAVVVSTDDGEPTMIKKPLATVKLGG